MGQNQNDYPQLVCEQLSARAEETSHVRLGSDQTDVHVARLVVQGDSRAAALLRGQEKPGDQSYDKDNFQHGQLRLIQGLGCKDLKD